MALPRGMPWFYFTLRYIEEALPHHLPPNSDEADNWRPPNDHTHFRELEETMFVLDGLQIPQGSLFRWRPGRIEVMHQTQNLQLRSFRTTSLYWSHDGHNYLLLPFDCTTTDSEAPPNPEPDSEDDENSRNIPIGGQSPPSSPQGEAARSWRRLRFGRMPGNRILSFVGYCQEYKRLGAYVHERWRRYLLPSPNLVKRDPSMEGTAQLAGNLNVLLGLIAFCTEKEQSIQAIRDTFWTDPVDQRRWTPCPEMEPYIERLENRGMVVEIFYDGTQQMARDLRDWEGGRWGAILT